MKEVITAQQKPPVELAYFRDRTIELLKLKSTPEVLDQVARLIMEMAAYRLRAPEYADILLRLEVELLNRFPAADPDSQN